MKLRYFDTRHCFFCNLKAILQSNSEGGPESKRQRQIELYLKAKQPFSEDA